MHTNYKFVLKFDSLKNELIRRKKDERRIQGKKTTLLRSSMNIQIVKRHVLCIPLQATKNTNVSLPKGKNHLYFN